MRRDLTNPNWSYLDLETSKGSAIRNYQSADVIAQNIADGIRASHKKKFPAMIERTSSPSSIYNCHGLVFASRRTQIDETETLRLILADDEYKKVAPEKVMAGDIILYLSSEGDIEHSGIVISPPSPENLNQPIVVSKWGPFTEVQHPAFQSPYDCSGLEYYRIDPQ